MKPKRYPGGTRVTQSEETSSSRRAEQDPGDKRRATPPGEGTGAVRYLTPAQSMKDQLQDDRDNERHAEQPAKDIGHDGSPPVDGCNTIANQRLACPAWTRPRNPS